MQKENSLFCLVLGLVPNKSLNRIFASYDLCNLLGYGTNRACWECISLSCTVKYLAEMQNSHTPNPFLANFGEFLMRCARPPKGMPKGPKKKKKKKITIDNTTLKHQNFRASNKERNFIQYIVSLHGKLASHC